MDALTIMSKLPIIVLMFIPAGLFLGGVYAMLRNPRILEAHLKWLYRPRVFFLMVATAVAVSTMAIWGAGFVAQQAKALTQSRATAYSAAAPADFSAPESMVTLHRSGDEATYSGIQVITTQEFVEDAPVVSLITAVSTPPVTPVHTRVFGDFKWLLPALPDLLFVMLGTLSFVPIGLITFIFLGLLMLRRSTQTAAEDALQRRRLLKQVLHDRLANGLLATALIMALGILISLGAA